MTDNLSLWHAVEKTSPEHVKEITGKAYRGNSPKPHYIVWRATETFGPAGIGWGFDIVEEKLLDGALLDPGFYERIHMARVRVWYLWNGQRGEVEHVGQTVFSGKRKDGKPFTDEDAPKKSVTDALIKALSMIGFAGDIFMGRYDDSKYVADLKAEERAEKQAANGAAPARQQPLKQQPAGIDEARQKAVSFKDKFIADVRGAQNLAQLNDVKNASANVKGLAALHDRHKDLWDDAMQAVARHETIILERAAA